MLLFVGREERRMKEVIAKINGFQREGHRPVIEIERELIRCKDCEHWNGDDNETFCSEVGIFGTDPNSFCSYARRKEEHSLEEMKAQGTE